MKSYKNCITHLKMLVKKLYVQKQLSTEVCYNFTYCVLVQNKKSVDIFNYTKDPPHCLRNALGVTFGLIIVIDAIFFFLLLDLLAWNSVQSLNRCLGHRGLALEDFCRVYDPSI